MDDMIEKALEKAMSKKTPVKQKKKKSKKFDDDDDDDDD